MITLAICSHNRKPQLKRALKGILSIDLGLSLNDIEILVIENSSDPNECVDLESETKDLVTWIHQSPGLSKARNRAVQEARNDLIAFLDDDALPQRGWLGELVKGFIDSSASIVGGPILPIWPVGNNPYSWAPDSLVNAFGVLNLGHISRILENHEYVYGANFAIDRSKLGTLTPFKETYGRIGGNLLSGEEIVLQDEVRKNLGTVYYQASAEVHHLIESNRLNPRWLMARISWEGLTDEDNPWAPKIDEAKELAVKYGGEEFLNILLDQNPGKEALGDLARIRRFLVREFLATENVMIETAKNSEHIKPIKTGVDLLILESYPNHVGILQGSFQSEKIQKIISDCDPWLATQVEIIHQIDYWRRTLSRVQPGTKVLIFTADPWLIDFNFKMLASTISEFHTLQFYLLFHRQPWDHFSQKNLISFQKTSAKIITMSKKLSIELASEGVKASQIPFPLNFEMDFLRKIRKPMISSEITVGFLGNLRGGKQPELVFSSSREVHSRYPIFKLKLAGTITKSSPVRIPRNHWIDTTALLFSENEKIRLLDSLELMNTISKSKIGFVFQGQDEQCAASGVLHLWIAAGKPVIALRNTESGRIVEEYSLGKVVDPDPIKVADAVIEVANTWDFSEMSHGRDYLESLDFDLVEELWKIGAGS